MASMTKDELKQALSSHGVDLPNSSARKDELVALYEDHVLPLEKSKTEFSSDEELELTPDDGGKKILADVFHLTDDQLLEALVKVGLEVGPIVDTTRRFYQKRLSAALLGERGADGQGAEKDSNGFSEGVEGNGSHLRRISANAEVNGTSDEGDFNGFGDVSKGDFSADDDHDEPQPSAEAKNVTSPIQSPAADSSSLRQRFADAVTSDRETEGRLRFTPTPRRSIHSYNLTETSKTTITKNRDGTIAKDHDYKRVTTSSDGVVEQSSNRHVRLYSIVRLLPRFFLLLIAVVLAYYVYTKGKK